MLFEPYDSFVSAWQHSGMAFTAFALALVIVAILSFVGTMRAWSALRRVRRAGASESASSRVTLTKLERDCATRAARLDLMFYLFAAVTSWTLFRCYFVTVDSKVPLGFYVLGQMVYVFGLAHQCSLVFVVVHVMQWITASRVAAAKRAAEGAGS
jgi:hypothetical protein